MRLSSRDLRYDLSLLPESSRPVSLRIGGMSYRMDAAEAIELATGIADAVAQLNSQPERKEP